MTRPMKVGIVLGFVFIVFYTVYLKRQLKENDRMVEEGLKHQPAPPAQLIVPK